MFPRAAKDAAVLAQLEPLLSQAAEARGGMSKALLNQINAVAAPSLVPTRQSQRVQAKQRQQQQQRRQRQRQQQPIAARPGVAHVAAASVVQRVHGVHETAYCVPGFVPSTLPLQPVMLHPSAAAAIQQHYLFMMSQRPTQQVAPYSPMCPPPLHAQFPPLELHCLLPQRLISDLMLPRNKMRSIER